MRHMHVWLDYMCMPQPSGGGDDAQLLKKALTPQPLQNQTAQENACSRKLSQRSHRLCEAWDGSEGNIAQQLNDAVESLPAYVELSWMMLVLAPTVEHKDRTGEIVDWSSWRTRGWYFSSHPCLPLLPPPPPRFDACTS